MSDQPSSESRHEPGGSKITEVCRELFSSIPRSDQRRWAEVCVRGLLTLPGRKTIKSISDHIAGGGAEQSLQQFVNQSTWAFDVVRRDVARRLTGALDPSFWVFTDVVIPKHGRYSVGVDRQFDPFEGRVRNCQMGLALYLSGDGETPVNWRLQLPAEWDEDAERRAKACVPDGEHHKPRWQHMLDVIDETSVDWGIPPRPIIGDLTYEAAAEPMLHGLEERQLPYVMKVNANRTAVTVPGTGKAMTFGQILADAVRQNRTAVNRWHLAPGQGTLTCVVAVRLTQAASRLRRPRYLVAEWSPTEDTPRTAWVTSLPPQELPLVLEGLQRHSRVREGIEEVYEDLGLRHFEGRSFTGWHHYSTLVSVAAACRVLCRRSAESSLADADIEAVA